MSCPRCCLAIMAPTKEEESILDLLSAAADGGLQDCDVQFQHGLSRKAVGNALKCLLQANQAQVLQTPKFTRLNIYMPKNETPSCIVRQLLKYNPQDGR